jgi:hypothetical protein
MTDQRYGFHVSKRGLARTLGIDRQNMKHKARGRQWIYPGEYKRLMPIIRQIRDGKLVMKPLRKAGGRWIYDAVVVDDPAPPVPEMVAKATLDFRGVGLRIIPAAPPARGMPTPEGVFGRATFWQPRRK